MNTLERYGLKAENALRLVAFAAEMAEHKELDVAEAAAELAVAADETCVAAWMALGAVRAKKREAASALLAYEHAAKLDPRSARLWCDVGEIKLSLYDYAGAAAALREALACDPLCQTPGGRRAAALIAKNAT